MVTPDRLRWLLGDARPTWYIPDGIYTDELEFAAKQPHKPLSELERVEVSRPGGLPAAGFRYVDDYGIEHVVHVTAAGPWAVDSHVEAASVWIVARPPDAPRPIHLNEVFDAAARRFGDSSLAELLEQSGYPDVSVAELLGRHARRVAAVSARFLMHGLETLASESVITAEDLKAIDGEAVVREFMEVSAHHVADLLPPPIGRKLTHQPSSTAVSWHAPDHPHGEVFSLKEEGTIARGKSRTFVGRTPPKAMRVAVSAGKVKIKGVATCGSLAKGRSCMGACTTGRLTIYASQRSDVMVTAVTVPKTGTGASG